MAETSLLDLNLRELLRRAEEMIDIKLLDRVIEAAIEPQLRLTYIRFSRPSATELGESVHPLIHIFRDEKTEEITAL